MVPSSGHYLQGEQGLLWALTSIQPSDWRGPHTELGCISSSGGVFSVMVLNAFPKRNREEMGAGVPALKLARLPSRPGAVERGACPPHAPQNLCVHNIIQ